MIIKELRIGSFAGIEDKIINFEKGVNIIYGDNEAGKSRIESFIKAMLYGLSTKRIKGESERKKYISFNKDTAYGEMLVSHKGTDYLIKRKFGHTKKNDYSEVFDFLTGEKVEYINRDEPGKYFFEINKSTFEKTLYISQLAVAFSKDKEEEIMEKITALFGCGDHEVSGEKAILKLDALKKSYVTSRGTGSLDLLKKKYNCLQEERYEGNKIAENNLEWERELIDKKQEKDRINREIENLEVYKKYLKKMKLQKEYKEIIQYFKESEELKKEESKLVESLSKDGEVIDEEFLNKVLGETSEYLRILDDKKEREQELNYYYESLDSKKSEFESYKFIELFGDNIKDRLLQIKYEQQGFEEKIKYSKEIISLINQEEKDLVLKKSMFNKININNGLEEKIINSLNLYESKLKELKEAAYSEKSDLYLEKRKNNEKFKMTVGILSVVFGIVLFFIKGLNFIIPLLFILFGGILFYLGNSRFDKLKDRISTKIEILTTEIGEIEKFLGQFREELNLENNEELITYIKKYMMFKQYEEKMLIRIEEKKRILNSNNYDEILRKYNKNNEMIKSLIKLSNCKNISEVIEASDKYTKIKSELEVINEKILNVKNIIENIESDIKKREYLLESKLKIMGAENLEFADIDVFIKEYREKVKKREEVHNNLQSIERTYSVLIKDKDIDKIREELKDVISFHSTYSYESEDEIEKEEKVKSKELIQCEKDIKDIENKINSRFIGKRNLVEIEEEIQEVSKEICKYKKNVKAIDLAAEVLKESMNEVRKTVGPALNKSIAEIFSYLTDGKYKEVKLDSHYEMMVRGSHDLFKGNYLSNGAYDQLYLSLRIALIEFLFKDEECTLILDDAFVQYDDKRRETALLLLKEKITGQLLIFTCHNIEGNIMLKNNIKSNYITI